MSELAVFQYAYMSDNYGQIIHDPTSGMTAALDAGDADALLSALSENGWGLDQLWITHHHGDHVAGLSKVKAETGCHVFGPGEGNTPVEGVDTKVKDGGNFSFAGRDVAIIHTPGHTLDMLNYHLPNDHMVFTGDTLFALGCGRVFEGDMAMMWESLAKLRALPGETRVWCGHEYTLANARFAVTVDPKNAALAERAEKVKALREKGEPTVPTSIETEKATNPFLRPDDEGIRAQLDMAGASDAEVFAEIRRRKDNF